MEISSSLKIALFILLSILLAAISRVPLHNPKCHGFYRFFAFEGILILLLLNAPMWFVDRYSPRQLVSWLLLFTSLFLVARGSFLLRKIGGTAARETNPENFAFENTVRLVTTGIYGYIRHPLYSSLLLLAWGSFLKNVTVAGILLVIATTAFLVITAKIEERENISFFGPAYRDYMHRTRMFIPFLI